MVYIELQGYFLKKIGMKKYATELWYICN